MRATARRTACACWRRSGVCVLAGLFQTVSHATLVLDAGGPQQPVGAVVLHATPGPALLLFSLWLLLRSQPEDHAV